MKGAFLPPVQLLAGYQQDLMEVLGIFKYEMFSNVLGVFLLKKQTIQQTFSSNIYCKKPKKQP